MLLKRSAIRVRVAQTFPSKTVILANPGSLPHTTRAGPDGAKVLDIFGRRQPNTRSRVRALVLIDSGQAAQDLPAFRPGSIAYLEAIHFRKPSMEWKPSAE
nr:hypothetical protein BDOA9_0206110 [Bradyrhizobium sp. DOA9]